MEQAYTYVKERWRQLTAFCGSEEIKEQLWNDIVHRYSERHRHYHNLNHIGYIFSLCDTYIDNVQSPAVMGFAILYHDIIYDTYRQDNEEQSAALAEQHLLKLRLNRSIIESIKTFILATKVHYVPAGFAAHNDLALFLDLDMAVLAEDSVFYHLYSEKIRKEYAQYSDAVYKVGRKQALIKMLDISLYNTPFLKETMEDKARKNLQQEIGTLDL